MCTFTLSIIGYIDVVRKKSGLTLEEVETALRQHGELYPWRVEKALAWAKSARPGENWQTDTDLRISDQADVYLTKE